MRIRCELFGCRTKDAPACERCGAGIYDGNFILRGVLSSTIENASGILARVRQCILPGRCEVCGRMVSRRGPFHYLCDREECHEQWIPF